MGGYDWRTKQPPATPAPTLDWRYLPVIKPKSRSAHQDSPVVCMARFAKETVNFSRCVLLVRGRRWVEKGGVCRVHLVFLCGWNGKIFIFFTFCFSLVFFMPSITHSASSSSLGLDQQQQQQQMRSLFPTADHHHHHHAFELVTYTRPTYCDHCDKFLWGVIKQGYQCRCKEWRAEKRERVCVWVCVKQPLVKPLLISLPLLVVLKTAAATLIKNAKFQWLANTVPHCLANCFWATIGGGTNYHRHLLPTSFFGPQVLQWTLQGFSPRVLRSWWRNLPRRLLELVKYSNAERETNRFWRCMTSDINFFFG